MSDALKQTIKLELTEYGSNTFRPFIQQGECSIVKFWPLTCRMHKNFNVDNYWPLLKNWQKQEVESQRSTIQPLIDAYHAIISNIALIMGNICDFLAHTKGDLT